MWGVEKQKNKIINTPQGDPGWGAGAVWLVGLWGRWIRRTLNMVIIYEVFYI